MNEGFTHLAEAGQVIGEYAKGALVWYFVSIVSAAGLSVLVSGIKRRNHILTGIDEERDIYRRED